MDLLRLFDSIQDSRKYDDNFKEKIISYFNGNISYEEVGVNEECLLTVWSLGSYVKGLNNLEDLSKDKEVLKRVVKFFFSIIENGWVGDVIKNVNINDIVKVYPEFYDEVISEEKLLFNIFEEKSGWRVKDGIKDILKVASRDRVRNFLEKGTALKTNGFYNYKNNLICYFIKDDILNAYKEKNYKEVKSLSLNYLRYLCDDYLCSDEHIRNGEIKGDKYRAKLSDIEKNALIQLVESGENWSENIKILKDNLKRISRGTFSRSVIAFMEIDEDFKKLFNVLSSMKVCCDELEFINNFKKMVLELATNMYIEKFYFLNCTSMCTWKNSEYILEKFDMEIANNSDLKEELSDYMVTYTVEHYECNKKVHGKVIRELIKKYGIQFVINHFKPISIIDKVIGMYEFSKYESVEELESGLEDLQLIMLKDLFKNICVDEESANTALEYVLRKIEKINVKKLLKKNIEKIADVHTYYIFSGERLERIVEIILESKKKELINFLINNFYESEDELPHLNILELVVKLNINTKEFLKQYLEVASKIKFNVDEDKYYYLGDYYKENIFYNGIRYLEENNILCLELGKKFNGKLKQELLYGVYYGNKSKEEIEILVDLLGEKQKGVLEIVLENLKDLDETVIDKVEEKIYSEIATYSGEKEVMAVEVLCHYASDKDRLTELYHNVMEPKSRDIISDKINIDIECIYKAENGEFDLDFYLDSVYKDEKKFPINLENVLIPLRKDGKDATRAVKQLIISYKNSDELAINKEGIKIAKCFTEDSLLDFAKSVFDYWKESGMNMKEKWQVLIPIIHGDYELIGDIVKLIEILANNSRQKLAVYIIKALGLNGSKEVFISIDKLGRKTKFKSIREASEEAFIIAADQLGISKGELGDTLIPDMGFENGYVNFQYGSETLKLFINSDLQIQIEKEDGKIVKSLPKGGKEEDEETLKMAKENFKQFKKEFKDMTTFQITRMEEALVEWRKWTYDKWQEVFLENPIMNKIGKNILWGIYKDDKLEKVFKLEKDLYDLNNEKIIINSKAEIGIVHPLELSQDEIKSWKDNFEKNKVEILFEQLDREILISDDIKGQFYEAKNYPRKSASTVINRLRKKGWNLGSIRDAGSFNEIYKEIKELNIGIELTFDCYPYMGYYGYEADSDDGLVGVKKVEFYRLGKIKRGSYIYDELEDYKGLRYNIEELQKRIVSELLLEMKKGLS